MFIYKVICFYGNFVSKFSAGVGKLVWYVRVYTVNCCVTYFLCKAKSGENYLRPSLNPDDVFSIYISHLIIYLSINRYSIKLNYIYSIGDRMHSLMGTLPKSPVLMEFCVADLRIYLCTHSFILTCGRINIVVFVFYVG